MSGMLQSVARRSGRASSCCTRQRAAADTDGMVLVPAGSFWMGSDDAFAYPDDGEGPPREVELDAYWIDACAVTNCEFAAFAADTAYVTEAERFGWSFVFAGLLPDDFPPTQAVAQAPWWRKVEGADWRHPEGPHSSLDIAARSSRRPRLVERRRRLRGLGRQAAPDRGGVGAGRARRSRPQGLPVGRRARARRRAPHERLAGRFPAAQLARGRLPRNCPGQVVPAERPRPLRDDGKRLGVDGRTASPSTGGGQGAEGRLVPLPPLVLPPVSRRRAAVVDA